MTYQYLTVEMVKAAKANGGFIDQKTFKTAGKYGFDSVILRGTSMQILDSYINFVRPLLKTQCNFVLVIKSRSQHSQLGNEMRKLVFDATGKYIHPTRYRQIVETQSLGALNDKEHQFCVKTKNIALSLPKCTIRSGDRAKLPSRLSSVFKHCRVPKDQKWTRR